MGVLSDRQLEAENIITPLVTSQKRDGVVSYGLGSYGVDIRAGYQWKIFTPALCSVIDPKNFDPRSFVSLDTRPRGHDWQRDPRGTMRDDPKTYQCKQCALWVSEEELRRKSEITNSRCPGVPQPSGFVMIPPNSFALTESVEYFKVPRDVLGLVIGKSTYARCGLVVNCTPIEPCLSADTEVLTRQGWRNIGNVLIGQEVLTRSPTGRAVFHPVEKKQERWFDGELMHFAGRSVDQLVTPDHKLFVWKHEGRHPDRTWVGGTRPAQEIFGRHNYNFDRQVKWTGHDQGCDPESLTIADEVYPAEDFLFFFGCWLGDGSAYKGADGGYSIKLAVVTKEAKRNTFRRALRQLNISAREHERGFHWYNKRLSLWLQQFGHAKDKFIPRFIIDLSPRLLRRLLDGLMASDGTVSTQTYTTSSQQLADDVQELAFKCGKAAIVRQVADKNKFSDRDSLVTYKVRICDDTMSPKMHPKNHSKVQYTGMVYDLTVSNHVFFCRRNGKASWTGNCWEGILTIELSNTTPLPMKVYVGEGIAQVYFIRSDEYGEATRLALRSLLTRNGLWGVTHEYGQKKYHTTDDRHAGEWMCRVEQNLTKRLSPAAACRVSYADRAGRYQAQQELTLPFVEPVSREGNDDETGRVDRNDDQR